MKKLICLALIPILLSSCSENPTTEISTEETPPESVNLNTVTDFVSQTPYTETTKDEENTSLPHIGLYIDKTGNDDYELTKLLEIKWESGKDIACFAAIPSQKKNVSGASYKNLWIEERDKNSRDVEFKIGYLLEFELKTGEKKSIEIKSPSDAEGDFTKFLEVYLYDDVHKEDGVWYSHLLETEMTNDTIITSLKLTAGTNINEVSSAALTVYSYNLNLPVEIGEEFTVNVVNAVGR